MRHGVTIALAMLAGIASSQAIAGDEGSAAWHQPAPSVCPELYVWTDTCNVYALKMGDAAILIDLGNGGVLSHLGEIGVTRVDWVLFTHHHREQCQGAPLLGPWRERGTRVAAPEAERDFFERPTDFRKMRVRLGDPFTIHGTSYLRPPIQPIALDRTLREGDACEWKGRTLPCVATPGNSPGGMTYLLREGSQVIAFSGDVMVDGSRMHTWFDTEWDYGFAAGIRSLRQSVATLQGLEPTLMLPSHGPVVRLPARQLEEYARKLADFERLYVRGYGVEEASAAYQDKVSTPTAIDGLAQVSPHVFKFKRPNSWVNFGLILADSGHALVVDCGLLDEKQLDAALAGMRVHYGLKAIDAVLITHMHGDHFLQAPYLRERWNAPIWALENMVEKMERPERFDYCAPIQAYGKQQADGSPLDGVRVDRAFKPGETFDWEGHHFTVDWMPGQTEFALCLSGVIDGRRVAFTGDNLFGDPDDPAQTGHEAMVAHNSAILEEGYIQGAEFLSRLQPDILVGGHSFVMDHPAGLIERYRRWAYEMREAFAGLSSDSDYRYGFDPFWVRAEPYRVAINPGETAEIAVVVRNFRAGDQRHRIVIATPPGITAEPPVLEGSLPGETRESYPVKLSASPSARPGVSLAAFDITLDGQARGQLFDLIVNVSENNE